MSTLHGTVALVTGASSGIGAATARRLAAEGAAVALLARRRNRLDELASTIGGGALVVEADVTSQTQAVAAVERAVAELGRLDTVVNNAGVMLLGPASDSPTDEWDRMVALNVQGSLYVTHSALPPTSCSSGPQSRPGSRSKSRGWTRGYDGREPLALARRCPLTRCSNRATASKAGKS